MPGRIETYLHSDSVTPNKGGALVKVLCDTDFGARTEEFCAFTKYVAKMAYATQMTSWDEMILTFPAIEDAKNELEKNLREKILVKEITILTL